MKKIILITMLLSVYLVNSQNYYYRGKTKIKLFESKKSFISYYDKDIKKKNEFERIMKN